MIFAKLSKHGSSWCLIIRELDVQMNELKKGDIVCIENLKKVQPQGLKHKLKPSGKYYVDDNDRLVEKMEEKKDGN